MDQTGFLHRPVNDIQRTLYKPLLIGIFYTEDKVSALMLSSQICIKRCPQISHMHPSGRTWRKSCSDLFHLIRLQFYFFSFFQMPFYYRPTRKNVQQTITARDPILLIGQLYSLAVPVGRLRSADAASGKNRFIMCCNCLPEPRSSFRFRLLPRTFPDPSPPFCTPKDPAVPICCSQTRLRQCAPP